MQVSRRTAVAVLATAALGGSAATGAIALAHTNGDGGHHGGHHRHHREAALVRTSLAPSVPADPTIHGVAPGALPWVLRHGDVRLSHDGRLRVDMRGLVIPVAPANGTPGPVTTVSASLFCGADTMPAGTTGKFPISRAGDAHIKGSLMLPQKCLGPVVLVNPNGSTAAYIAASGFGG